MERHAAIKFNYRDLASWRDLRRQHRLTHCMAVKFANAPWQHILKTIALHRRHWWWRERWKPKKAYHVGNGKHAIAQTRWRGKIHNKIACECRTATHISKINVVGHGRTFQRANNGRPRNWNAIVESKHVSNVSSGACKLYITCVRMRGKLHRNGEHKCNVQCFNLRNWMCMGRTCGTVRHNAHKTYTATF